VLSVQMGVAMGLTSAWPALVRRVRLVPQVPHAPQGACGQKGSCLCAHVSDARRATRQTKGRDVLSSPIAFGRPHRLPVIELPVRGWLAAVTTRNTI
jgi:hypothetical protein